MGQEKGIGRGGQSGGDPSSVTAVSLLLQSVYRVPTMCSALCQILTCSRETLWHHPFYWNLQIPAASWAVLDNEPESISSGRILSGSMLLPGPTSVSRNRTRDYVKFSLFLTLLVGLGCRQTVILQSLRPNRPANKQKNTPRHYTHSHLLLFLE